MEAADAVGTQEKKGIAGSTLKMIAIITMLIDHTAAVVLMRSMIAQNLSFMIVKSAAPIVILYYVMRSIGRLGFPIFIFLLMEGLEHTRNKWKYLLRLVIFALVSEIPFDFAFNLSRGQISAGQIIEFGYQNVFFTLAIGLLTVIGLQAIQETEWNTIIKIVVNMGITIAGMGLGLFLRTDYSAVGVLAIVIMYLFRKRKLLAAAMTCVVLLLSNVFEISAFLILLPIGFYNGKRGWKLKWVFYAFYPVHLLVLWLICLGMGIA